MNKIFMCEIRLISELINRFVRILASIPPKEEYISQQSRRYWFFREQMDKLNGKDRFED